MNMAKEGSVYGVFKDTSTQYYVPDNLLNNDDSDTETCVLDTETCVLDTDPNDYECFINMHNEYMVYINDTDTMKYWKVRGIVKSITSNKVLYMIMKYLMLL
ncbi:hypothetical protein [Salmonella phage SD-1_S14]|nr:hypothetical protein [Salmonella phage SD-1_S14]